MAGRFGKYGDSKRKARLNKGRLFQKNKLLTDPSIKSRFLDHEQGNQFHPGSSQAEPSRHPDEQ